MAHTAETLEMDPQAAGERKLIRRSGAEAIVEALQAAGVEMVFGYSGGGTSTLVHQVATAGMANMNGRTEMASAWMSYGYNRVKGHAASACLFHCVGALHASPMIYAAKTDGTPLLSMDISLDSSLDFREGLQDSSELFHALKPIAKHARKVVTADDLPLAIRQALLAANTGRPGPAVLDIAYQALNGETTCPAEPLKLPRAPAADSGAIAEALAMIRAAERPVLFVGAGVHMAGAAAELQALAEQLQIPIVSTSWGGRGVVSDDHPLFAGVVGSFGWTSANDLIQRADLWVAVGVSFSQMTTGAWNLVKPAKVVQIDVDPTQIGKIFEPTLGIAAHAKIVLRQLINAASLEGYKEETNEALVRSIQESKQEWYDYLATLAEDGGEPINQYYLIQEIAAAAPADAMIVGDSGSHAYMLYRAYHYRAAVPMALGSRYMSLGAGLPVAIGAKLAAPERTVICFHGDGGFYYNFAELSTLAERKIKVIVVLDNNRALAANRAGLSLTGIINPWVDLPDTTDFVTVAKGQGIEAERVTKAADFAAAFQRALAAEGSYLIDVWSDPETRVRRAIKGVIPILSDRKPAQTAAKHFSPPLEGSWPA